VRYMPLARKVARRYWRSSVPDEELMQVACVGLINAIDRFDPARGRPFPTFAIPTILGGLRRYFRDSSWSVHVARGAQERAKAVQDAITALSGPDGRAPTASRVAVYLEISEEEVVEALQVSQAYTASSLDAPTASGEDEVTVGSTIGEIDRGYEDVEREMLLHHATAFLTPRERRLLQMRFTQEMTQAQIGALLGVSQMQVSRLLRATLAKVRERMSDEPLPRPGEAEALGGESPTQEIAARPEAAF